MAQTILSEKQSTVGGLESDVVNLAYHLRKKGSLVYKENLYRPSKAYIYNGGAWHKVRLLYIFYDKKLLISADGYTLSTKDTLRLKGGEKWQTIR